MNNLISIKTKGLVSMKKTIFITAIPNPGNLGSMAVIMSAKQLFETSIPNSELAFLSTYYLTAENRKLYEKYGINILDYTIFKGNASKYKTFFSSFGNTLRRVFDCISYRVCKKFHFHSRSIFERCDAIVDLSTESINDLYGFGIPLFTLFNIALWLITGKPVILCASSAGPIKNRLLKYLVSFIINKVDMISLREEISKNYLLSIGVKKPKMVVTADLAFLMNPVSSSRVKLILNKENIDENNKPIIGIAPSQLIHRYAFPNITNREVKYNEYVKLICEIVDHIIDNFGKTVILIPHVVMPTIDNSQDDRIVIQEILKNVKNKENVRPLIGEYMPDELKAVISKCDMFIGCRMHSVIAATSMGVPTIALSYGTKFEGVIGKIMDQNEWVIKIENISYQELLVTLKSKIDGIWAAREDVEKYLNERSRIVKKLSYQNGLIVNDFLNYKK